MMVSKNLANFYFKKHTVYESELEHPQLHELQVQSFVATARFLTLYIFIQQKLLPPPNSFPSPQTTKAFYHSMFEP